jgi:hypothetical protein
LYCCTRIPQTEYTQQKFISSWFWKSKTESLALGKGLFSVFSNGGRAREGKKGMIMLL